MGVVEPLRQKNPAVHGPEHVFRLSPDAFPNDPATHKPEHEALLNKEAPPQTPAGHAVGRVEPTGQKLPTVHDTCDAGSVQK